MKCWVGGGENLKTYGLTRKIGGTLNMLKNPT